MAASSDGAARGKEPDPVLVFAQALGRPQLPPLVLLNANCSDLLPLRRWANERYVELAHRIFERYPEARIVLIAGNWSTAIADYRRYLLNCLDVLNRVSTDRLQSTLCSEAPRSAIAARTRSMSTSVPSITTSTASRRTTQRLASSPSWPAPSPASDP